MTSRSRPVDLIDVEYEELPAVFEVEEALADGAPQLHPDFPTYRGGKELPEPSNAYFTSLVERGDVSVGFAAADYVVENTYYTQRQHQAYLEPQTVMMEVDGDKVNVWACSKAPYDTRNALGVSVQIEPDDLVFNHTYIGGDFGGKATPANLPIVYFLAKATGRPVLHGARLPRGVSGRQPAPRHVAATEDRRDAGRHDHGA